MLLTTMRMYCVTVVYRITEQTGLDNQSARFSIRSASMRTLWIYYACFLFCSHCFRLQRLMPSLSAYSPKHMERIAQLFEVPVERLLDDYNLFLRNGQGKQIKAIRMKLGLTQREYADRLGISLCNLKQWEQNRKQLFSMCFGE